MPVTRSEHASSAKRIERQVSQSVSHASSRLSNVSKARVNLKLAELEQKRIRAEMERQKMLDEAEMKVEMARLSLQISGQSEDEDSADCSDILSCKSQPRRLDCYLNDCEKQLGNDCEAPRENAENVRLPPPAQIYPFVNLPKVELQTFDGTPSRYWGFVRQFEEYVEKYTNDPGQRFLYLQHYCVGRAKRAIQELVILPREEAYNRARQVLRDLFGQPHVLVRLRLEELLGFPKIRSNDATALTDLAMQMKGCEISLTQLHRTADLNAAHTLEAIMAILPPELQREWCKMADRITCSNRDPLFNDLQSFVADNARIANSNFSCAHRDKEGQNNVVRRHGTPRSFLTETNQMSRIPLCPFCEDPHEPPSCPKFLQSDGPSRWNIVRTARCCFICLNFGHISRNCTQKKRCQVNSCRRWHHDLLHLDLELENSMKNPPQTVHSTMTNSLHSPLLGIVPVIIRTPHRSVSTYALLDDGSDCTLITEALVRELELDRRPSTLNIVTATGCSRSESSIVKFEVLSLNGEETVDVERAFVIADLPIAPPPKNMASLVSKWPHLADVKLNVLNNGSVGLLLGTDVPEAHWVLDQRRCGRKQPFAVLTLLGWVLRGPLGAMGRRARFVNHIQSEEETLLSKLRDVFDSEFADASNPDRHRSVDDARAENIVSSSCCLHEGRYTMALPWKSPEVRLPNNREVVVKRLYGLKRRLIRDAEMMRQYSESIDKLISKGYAQRVGPGDPLVDTERVWYLPHHAVFHPRKPGKLRVVLDCAAECGGQSLNDNLLQGPDITADLSIVLLRFRKELVSVASDIEEMFMQVRVPQDDRRSLRFLWWEKGIEEEPSVFQMVSHPFGATSSPFCATYALQQTIRDFGHLYHTATRTEATTAFYVDDCLASFPTTADAQRFILESREMLLKGGFKLRKWISNEPSILRILPLEDRADTSSRLDNKEHVLGLEWNTLSDKFCFDMNLEKPMLSRRQFLRGIASIFDPLGVISPLILPARIVLQNACRQKIGWDDPLSDEDTKGLYSWRKMVTQCQPVEVHRCLRRDRQELIVPPELHMFSDASESAYGAVAYILYRNENGNYWSLVGAKSRVAPIKTVTIPRLELSAAVLATRLQQTVTKALGIGGPETSFWTDSMTVLYYIKNSAKRFPTFVANRVAEICRSTLPGQWNHVTSGNNPADIVSRGIRSVKDWEAWLTCTVSPDELRQGAQMIEKTEQVEEKIDVMATLTVERTPNMLLNYYSSWTKLLHSVAWLNRFKSWIMSRVKKNIGQCSFRGSLTVGNIKTAERDVLLMLQREAFPDRLKCTSKDSSLRRLCPVIRNDLICVGGRMQYGRYDEDSKHPAILPSRHPVVDALIRHVHVSTGHSGAQYVLSAIRKSYWIIHGLRAVKRVTHSCITCRKAQSGPAQQIMAPLPAARVQAGWFPFQHVGIDFFGPFTVKAGRARVKRYGCLFTCMQIRAIHLELASDLSTDVFIMAFMRFVGRRGYPAHVYSDNGTNFIGAVRELKDMVLKLDKHKVYDTALACGIQWHFNPPYCSHRGGAWERLIRSVRKILLQLAEEQICSEEILRTLLIRAEEIINNRPLTTPSSDHRDADPLTPNDLLMVGGEKLIFGGIDLQQRYTKRWRQVNHLASVFWYRWRREYLPTLQPRYKWLDPSDNMKVGELVLVRVTPASRNSWPVGVIERADPDEDGRVRTVTVRIKSGPVVRDVRSVYRLEGDAQEEVDRVRASGIG